MNLQANNCTICLNTIIGNGTSGISASNSFNNTIAYNTITCNDSNGIQSNSSSNMIYGNTISGCESGIYSENSNNKIFSNLLTNNLYGIWTYNSTDTIQFNRITLNTYGLRNDIGTVNATNNWWGTNNPSNPNDIWIVSGNVNYNPWLVLSVNASSTNSGGNSSVTADLTHNNQGEDTTPQGHVPNGIPVNFTTNYGTIITTSYTVKGRATTILNLGSTENATVTATASLDNQNSSTTGFISVGTVILTITSTAIDNSTGQPLNTTYTIPLNNSVTWLSVLWINTDMFTDELQIIVDGTVVQDKYFNNTAYTTWQNSYPSSVFNAILYTNKNLPFSSDSEFWNNLTTTYNLTSTELEFVQIHRQEFMDNLTVNMVYSGLQGLNLTVTDPQNNINVVNLNFPGNVINRVSQVIYGGSEYEGVKSFAIATTDVNNNVLQYWSDQESNYQIGAINIAYNTFLAVLLVEYLHDQIANNLTSQYNVTWSRTSPIIVSMCHDAYETYMTLECDHSMGMTVVGKQENTFRFNYECSSAISYIEYAVMNYESDSIYQSYSTKGAFSSVMMSLLYEYLDDNTSVESFVQNGFIITKSKYNNNNFIVIDLETGIARDINTVNNFCGAYKDWYPIRTISIIGNWLLYWQTSNPWDLGDKIFAWDGKGRVFLTSSRIEDPSANLIWADNELTITGPNGSICVRGKQSAVDITDILNQSIAFPFLQSIHLEVKDTDKGFIGTSPLYIVQVIFKNPLYEDIKKLPIWDVCNDIASGKKQINIGRFVKFSSGITEWYVGTALVESGMIMMVDPPTTEIGIIKASIGIGMMIYGAEQVWGAAFMPIAIEKSYEDQIKDWPTWFI
ncbi:MAG: NosD domain-containing protein [Methanobacterium sp.]|nr:NosD domain-containing protein [Methanobacterium sp.]